MSVNPLSMDPSRTTALRNRYAADVGRRFNTLSRAVGELVLGEDAFGLTVNAQWAFETNEQKLRSFRSWLRYQTAQNILGTDAEDPKRPWTADYVYSAYQRGVRRAATDAKRGKEQEQLEARLTTGAQSLERLQMLYTRSFEDLKGVTYAMSVQMSKVLAFGLLHGTGPREIARQLQEQVGFSRSRAETIARTEIIAVHAHGQLDGFEALGIDGVGARAEWSTAGDRRVCARCHAMEGRVFSIKEARGKIPLHPRCRCVWLPVLEDTETQVERKSSIRRAVKQSAARSRP